MKKILICLFSVFCLLNTNIQITSVNAKETENVEFTQESIKILEYEMGIDSPYKGQYLTYSVDKNNNIIRIENNQKTRSFLTISVFVKGAIVGCLTATVIDGIVISVTGQSGAWWCAQAINNVIILLWRSHIFRLKSANIPQKKSHRSPIKHASSFFIMGL